MPKRAKPPQRGHRPRGLRRAAAVVGAGVVAMIASGPLAAYEAPDWDQVANIKEAASRLAQLQRRQGASKAFEFIEACYRTHSLSEEYSKPFEACIAQDYMETQILALIYSRIPDETLRRLGAPTPQLLARSMGNRVAQAFATYKVPAEDVKTFKKLVDQHGFPLFFATVFPGVKVPKPGETGPRNEPQPPSEDGPGAAPKAAPGSEAAPEEKKK